MRNGRATFRSLPAVACARARPRAPFRFLPLPGGGGRPLFQDRARLRAASPLRNVFRRRAYSRTGAHTGAGSSNLAAVSLPLLSHSVGVRVVTRARERLARSLALPPSLPPAGNTLDRAESHLSARLPRIMDATVTHVNEACHLHLLLRLRRVAASTRPTPG